jgi:hypothetical protein
LSIAVVLQGSSQNGHLCGATLPPVSNASANVLYVRLITDGAGVGKGFKLRYQASAGDKFYSLLHTVFRNAGAYVFENITPPPGTSISPIVIWREKNMKKRRG